MGTIESKIIDIILEVLGQKECAIKSKSRETRFIRVRQLIHYFLKIKTSHTLAEISVYTNNCDHSIVLHSVKRVNNIIETKENPYCWYVESINNKIDNITKFPEIKVKSYIFYKHSKLK